MPDGPEDGMPRLDHLIRKKPPRAVIGADEVSAAIDAAGSSLGFAVPRTDAAPQAPARTAPPPENPPSPSPVRKATGTPRSGRPARPRQPDELARLAILLPAAMIKALKMRAIADECSVSEIARRAMHEWLEP